MMDNGQLWQESATGMSRLEAPNVDESLITLLASPRRHGSFVYTALNAYYFDVT